MLEKIKACFERLQGLDIMPTLGNMEKLVQTLYDLRDMYTELKNAKDAEADGTARDVEDTEIIGSIEDIGDAKIDENAGEKDGDGDV